MRFKGANTVLQGNDYNDRPCSLGRKVRKPRQGLINNGVKKEVNELAVSEQGIQGRKIVIRVECLIKYYFMSS